jgi:cell division protein FtsB
MKWLAVGLALVIVLLQYRIWFSEAGVRELDRLQRAVAAQRSANDQLSERNRELAAEVRDLKTGLDALEERARSDLGMIAGHETFYQVVPSSSPPASARSPTRTAEAH